MKLRPLTLGGWDVNVRERLHSMGLFSLLRTKIPHITRRQQNPDSDVWLQFFSATDVNGSIPKALRKKTEDILGSLGDLRRSLYGPLIEGIKNAVEHAYPVGFLEDEEASRIGTRWWMLGVAYPATKKIRVIIADQGVTIPISLPKSGLWPGILSMLGYQPGSDAERIEQAAAYGRTRTGQPGRGTGLAEMVNLASQDSGNEIRIYSRTGFFHVIGGTTYVCENNSTALSGTLIQWDLTVPSVDGRHQDGLDKD